MTTRRELIIAGAACAITAPLACFAQARGKVWRVGFFYFASRQSAIDSGRYQAFVQGMRDLGYVEGRNLIVEARFAEARPERAAGLAAELVRLKVHVIVATGTRAYQALQHATTTIPIVITVTADPVSGGYAASISRPGGNITGLSDSAADLNPKLLELMTAAAPKLSRIGVLLHPDNVSHSPQLKALLLIAQKAGSQIVLAEAATVPEIESGFAVLSRERAQAVIIFNDGFFFQNLPYIAAQALKQRVPSIYALHEYADAGGLMSYGPDMIDNFRGAAIFVDKILKGAKPGELPFEQPRRYYLVLNLKTAKALGIAIPQQVLVRADRVIE